MPKPITRCKQCLHADKEARQEPCNKCNEIQHPRYKCDNHFAPKGDEANE